MPTGDPPPCLTCGSYTGRRLLAPAPLTDFSMWPEPPALTRLSALEREVAELRALVAMMLHGDPPPLEAAPVPE